MERISIARTAWVALRFIVCGVGGFLLLMTCSVALVPDANGKHFLNPLLALFLAVVAAAMMLLGVGMWNRPAYLLVFLSFPVSLYSLALAGGDKEMGVFLIVTPMLVAYALVRRYYRRRDDHQPKPETDSTSALTSQHQEIK
ncbi:MAG TPA: hypothetical protein VJN89_04145 [Candidatus Acidoferrum sp.]|nr:hypothetical protein [Candidatus Acidoferrum sp.]